MTSTRKYDINRINSSNFIKIFRKERPIGLSANVKDEDCEQMARHIVQSLQIALEHSAPKFNPGNQSKQNTIAYRLPRNVRELFHISRALLDENRRKHYRSTNYQNSRPNYSKQDFFEKQLSFYVGDQCPNQLINKKVTKTTFSPVDDDILKELIDRLPSYKLPGLDLIPNEIWQCILKCDEKYLIEFINTLIKSSYFPTCFKQGKLIAFRKPHRTGNHPSNYRFITIQSAICKIYERLIVERLKDQNLMNYLNKVTNQHGFTRDKSRITALNTIVNEMQSVKQSYQYGVVVQLDISRAFDLISWNHILNIALNNLGSQKFVLIVQLLKGRTIKMNDYVRELHRGLPQGSPSSHLLWLIGTSDLMLKLSAIENLTSAGFVDDLMFVVKGHSPNEVFDKINSIKMVVEGWLKSAALNLNEKKCYVMQFSGSSKINLSKLVIDRVKLKQVNELKYLGVHLNANLDFYSQIRDIQHRINDAIKAIQTIFAYSRRTLNYEDRLQIYRRAIRPIMINGWSVFAKEIICVKSLTDRLLNAQKRCLVVLFNESDYNRNSELCRIHKILPIHIDLQIKICEQYATDKQKRKLTKKERQLLQLRVMQENYFHW